MNIQTTNNNQAEIEQGVFLDHVRKLAVADAAVEKAGSERRKVRKQAKADGILLNELDKVIMLAEMGRDETRRHMETVWKYAEWMRVALPGDQADMFAEPDDDPTAEDSGEKSEARTLEEIAGKGYRAGIMGVGQKEALAGAGLKGNDPMGQEFLKAWTAGQSMIAAEMGSKH